MASQYFNLPLHPATISGVVSTTQAAMTPTYAQSLLVANTGVITLTKPAGAKKAKVMTPLTGNTVDLRITLDGTTTPSSTVGMQMQPGRSEDFDAVGDLKVIAETAATGQSIFVHWSV